MSDNEDAGITGEAEPEFEMTPEEATSLGGGRPGQLNRKRVLIAVCVVLSAVIGGGMIAGILKPSKKTSSPPSEYEASSAGTPSEFLSSLYSRALYRREREPQPEPPESRQEAAPEPEASRESLLPSVSFMRPEAEPAPVSAPRQSQPAAQPAPGPQPEQTHFRSPLVPAMQGSLFSQPAQAPQAASAQGANYSGYNPPSASQGAASQYAAPRQASDYAAQNDQQNKQAFYDSSGSGGAAFNGTFLGENAVWTGTVIPGILETAINTDLPGNVLARVTQNVYDSKTGSRLLIPQGTLLVARYNSSISYAQKRVQIVWDALIRPDGYQLDLEGANGADASGMSGQKAKYSENWFEYLKAAGIVTLFSIANARMTEAAADYAAEASAANIAEANSGLVSQLGGNLASRAMNIQPTLTVENGTLINVMLNKTLYLPPVAGFPASQKYILE